MIATSEDSFNRRPSGPREKCQSGLLYDRSDTDMTGQLVARADGHCG